MVNEVRIVVSVLPNETNILETSSLPVAGTPGTFSRYPFVSHIE